MALHPDFPESPHEIIDPSVHWRDNDYSGAAETSNATMTIVEVTV
jgi:hypothetical protein